MSGLVRTEVWERRISPHAAVRVVADVDTDETVMIAVPVLHQMLTDLGYEQVTT